MDAILAFVFIVLFTIVLVGLFVTAWMGSIALVYSPRWVADRVVLRFWPERMVDGAALRRYRAVGIFGIAFSATLTYLGLLEIL